MCVETVDSIMGVIDREIETYNKDLRGKSGKGEVYEDGWLSCLCYVRQHILRTIREQEEQEMEVREVSYEEACEEIVDLIKSNPDGLYYSDIIEALNIDADLVITACDNLAEEGKIKDLGIKGGEEK